MRYCKEPGHVSRLIKKFESMTLANTAASLQPDRTNVVTNKSDAHGYFGTSRFFNAVPVYSVCERTSRPQPRPVPAAQPVGPRSDGTKSPDRAFCDDEKSSDWRLDTLCDGDYGADSAGKQCRSMTYPERVYINGVAYVPEGCQIKCCARNHILIVDKTLENNGFGCDKRAEHWTAKKCASESPSRFRRNWLEKRLIRLSLIY